MLFSSVRNGVESSPSKYDILPSPHNSPLRYALAATTADRSEFADLRPFKKLLLFFAVHVIFVFILLPSLVYRLPVNFRRRLPLWGGFSSPFCV